MVDTVQACVNRSNILALQEEVLSEKEEMVRPCLDLAQLYAAHYFPPVPSFFLSFFFFVRYLTRVKLSSVQH